MGEEIDAEQAVEEEDDSPAEITIEQRLEILRKARWNVFMYLGIAILMFAFAMFPFSHEMEMDSRVSDYPTGYIWGVVLPGEDFTDVPVEVSIDVANIPADTNSIEVTVIKANSCVVPEVAIGQNDARTGYESHSNQIWIIDDVSVGSTYEHTFKIDPGLYCIEAFIDSDESVGYDVTIDVSTYPNQFIAGALGAFCLALSLFAFIGAQKHGKFVKNLTAPEKELSMEDKVLAETSSTRLAVGPSGPPNADGPGGPPTGAGPSGPPSAGPSGPPKSSPVEEPAKVADVYEDQGEGYYFRKFPDGTYDQTVYVVEEGQYIPYRAPE